ncbi:MAG TPA: hypothetical protein VM285_00770 [Polyangia bacterium]|nr:hypothetical protein [Polyangia bacterium]
MAAEHSITGGFETPTASRPLIVAAGCLIGLWFVPETWILGPVFQSELIGNAGFLETAGALAGPACGALLLVLAFARLPAGFRLAVGAILGAAALALPLMGRASGIQLPVALVLPASIGLSLLAALAWSRERVAAAHLLLLVVPLTALVPFLLSAAFGDVPLTYFAGLKAPVRIWAAGLALASAVGQTTKHNVN